MIAALCALITLIGCACAEAEYRSAGGFIAQAESGDLYIAASEGIVRASLSGIEMIVEGAADDLQIIDGMLYYTRQIYDEGGNRTVSIESLDTATGERAIIADPLPAGTEFEFDPNFFYQTRHTSRYGYADIAVQGDYIYYIGDDNSPGANITECIDWNDAAGHTAFRTEYESCAAVYRMDRNGENAELLIPHLGNGANAHMVVTDDRIIISTCWQNAVASDNFANFIRYDLNGAPIDMITNTAPDRHAKIYRADQEFTCTVSDLIADDDAILASIAVSGAESAASLLVNPADIASPLAYEAFCTPSAMCGESIVYLASDVQGAQWEDRIFYTLRLMVRDARGDRCIAYIPPEYSGYDMRIAVLGDAVYLRAGGALVRAGGALVRAAMDGGTPQLLTENGFEICDAFAPAQYALAEIPEEEPTELPKEQYLLPGSDVRLLTEEELSIYDVELLQHMRNEILARHGYIFPDPADNDFFAHTGWYQQDPNFTIDDLTDIERANIATIDSVGSADSQ